MAKIFGCHSGRIYVNERGFGDNCDKFVNKMKKESSFVFKLLFYQVVQRTK